MDADGDRYDQRVEVTFAGFGKTAPAPAAPGLVRRLGRGLAVLPSGLAMLRKITLDLGAVCLIAVVLAYFVSALNQNAIVIEAPAVPRPLQDRGITPELLVQLIQARVQSIYAAVATPVASEAEAADRQVPPAVPLETIQAQIDGIYRSFGLQLPAAAGRGAADGERAAMNEAFPPKSPGGGGMSDAERVIAALESTVDMVTDQIDRTVQAIKLAEVAAPPPEPLVIAAAGLNLSVDSLAQAARRLLGAEARRRLTLSIVCGLPGCGEALTLRVVATSGKAVAAETMAFDIADLDRAVAQAGDQVLRAYDPRTLAAYYYDSADLAAAREVARQVSEKRQEDTIWAGNMLGLIAVSEGDYTSAAGHFEAALAADPHYVPAQVNLGVAHFRNGDFEFAKEAFVKALALNPQHVVAYTNLGNARFRLCDWQGAAAAYERALDADPQSIAARHALDLVKNIEALKAYLPEEPPLRASVVDQGADAQVTRKVRRLDQVVAAAAFCKDLARKPL